MVDEDIDPKRFAPRALQARISRRQEPAARARGDGGPRRLVQRRGRVAGVPPLRRRAARQRGDGLRRPADGHGPADGERRGGARPLADALRARAGGRVPGHQPRPVPPGARARRAPAQRDGGGRRRPGHLLVARRRRGATSSTSSATTPTPTWSRWSRTTGPRGRSCARRTRVVERNPHRHPSGSGPTSGDGEPITVVSCRDEHEEAARGGRRHRPGAGARRQPLRHRGLLPHQRPEPRDRGSAGAPGGQLHGGRRPAVLRARRGARPARLPARGRQPRRRGQPGAHVRRAQARPRPGLHRQARGLRRRPRAADRRRPCCAPTRSRGSSPRQRATIAATRRAARGHPPAGGRREPARPGHRGGHRPLRAARGPRARGHLRGPGAHREPRRDGARRGRVRRIRGGGDPRRASSRASRCRPTPTWWTSRAAR